MLTTQIRAIINEAAETDAAQFLAEGGALATIGDWDAEAFALFRQRNGRLFEDCDVAPWDDAWELYHERFLARCDPAWAQSAQQTWEAAASPAQLRRARVCPTCGAAVGLPCSGTRDHNSRYVAAQQAPPTSGPSGGRAHRRGDGLLLTDEALAGDLARALTLTLQGRTLSYPEEASTPEKRAACLLGEARALAERFTVPPERQ